MYSPVGKSIQIGYNQQMKIMTTSVVVSKQETVSFVRCHE